MEAWQLFNIGYKVYVDNQLIEVILKEFEIEVLAVYEGGEILGKEFTKYISIQAFINPLAQINEDSFRKEMMEYLILENWDNLYVLELDEIREAIIDQLSSEKYYDFIYKIDYIGLNDYKGKRCYLCKHIS